MIRWLIVWFWLLPALIAGIASATTTESLDHGLVDWLNNREGGYWNPKQQIRRADPNDPNSMRGVFAVERIEKGEVLCHVPWHSVISGYDEKSGQDWNGSTYLSCNTVRNLQKEFQLGSDSELAPYISYLSAQRYRQLPSTWSQQGQDLLREILGGDEDCQTLPPWSPFSWYDNWVEECNGDPSDEFQLQTAMLVVQRADEDVMTPLYDLYNHQNGRINTQFERIHGQYHQTSASKTIEAGEQIFNTYNLCDKCGERHWNFGTPEILKDYGFVEEYPQRWYFFGRHGVRLEIFENDNGEVVASFDQEIVRDSEFWNFAVNFMKEELLRLKRVKQRVMLVQPQTFVESVPKAEQDVIWSYLSALMTAMQCGLKELLGPDDVTVPTLDAGHYNNLTVEPPPLTFSTSNCANEDIFLYSDFEPIDTIKTNEYDFVIIDNDVDTCFFVETEVQVCASYRPFYYETLVHLPAQFIEQLKRVLFVGYGNPMIVTEILKYESVELIVGLGTDPEVTRTIQQHFDTKTFLDDGNVHWWFGELSSTLSVLPDEYFGTFDLVVVDTVIDEPLDLTLLKKFIQPQTGILVSHGLDFDTLGKSFSYTMRSFHQAPVVCSIPTVLASDGVDFAHDKIFGRELEVFSFEPIVDAESRCDMIHDYRGNDSINSSCNARAEPVENPILAVRQVGTIENEFPLSIEKRASALDTVLSKSGFQTLVTTSTISNPSIVTIAMDEGYAMSVCWEQYPNCTLQVVLNRNADMLNNLESLQWENSYRQVISSMTPNDRSGVPQSSPQSEKWSESMVQCKLNATLMDTTVLEAAVTKTVELLNPTAAAASIVVLCSEDETVECPILTTVQKLLPTNNIVPIRGCTFDSGNEPPLVECEKKTYQMLADTVKQGDIALVLVDSATPASLLQAFDSLWSSQWNRNAHFADRTIVMYVGDRSDGEASTLYRNFLQRLRISERVDPLMLVEYQLHGTEAYNANSMLELIILRLSESSALEDYLEMEKSLQAELLTTHHVKLSSALGGSLPYDYYFTPDVAEVLFEYDNDMESGDENGVQDPLEWQSMIRLEWKEPPSFLESEESLLQFLPIDRQQPNNVGYVGSCNSGPSVQMFPSVTLVSGCLVGYSTGIVTLVGYSTPDGTTTFDLHIAFNGSELAEADDPIQAVLEKMQADTKGHTFNIMYRDDSDA